MWGNGKLQSMVQSAYEKAAWTESNAPLFAVELFLSFPFVQ
jgi:hypothetical protein